MCSIETDGWFVDVVLFGDLMGSQRLARMVHDTHLGSLVLVFILLPQWLDIVGSWFMLLPRAPYHLLVPPDRPTYPSDTYTTLPLTLAYWIGSSARGNHGDNPLHSWRLKEETSFLPAHVICFCFVSLH